MSHPADPGPFVIGVTGHRSLGEGDLAGVRGAVSSFLVSMRALLPDAPLLLALGTDTAVERMVADVARECGVAVEPLAAPAGSDAQVAALVQRSNLLLALWDGQDSALPGSAATTVLRFLHIQRDRERSGQSLACAVGDEEALVDAEFLYWIPVAPAGGTLAPFAAAPGFVAGLGDSLATFGNGVPAPLRQRLEGLNEYHHDAHRVTTGLLKGRRDSLLTGVPEDLAPGDLEWLRRIDAEYGRADKLALRYQRRSDRLFGLFGVFTFVLGSLFLVYDKLSETSGLLLVYLAVLLGTLVLYRVLYTKVWFVRHLRYRALAETLRVKFYLCLAGIGRGVDAAEMLALSRIEQFEGFGWLGDAVKNVDPVVLPPESPPNARRTEFVARSWVQGQHQYFARRVRRLEAVGRQVARGQRVVILVTVAVLMARLLFGPFVRHVYVAPEVPLKNLLMFVADILALSLGAWKLHQSKMATRELTWQYKKQLDHFSRYSAALERTAAPARRAEQLAELGRRSLMENYLWTIHRYHREHSPPAT